MHRAISWLRPVGSRGDHGMNQRFRLLTCLFLFALALLTVFSSDAVAVARQKQTQHAKKADARRTKHHAAHKKGNHVALAATVRRFIAGQPASAKGRFALARGLLAEGDRDGAARLVREAWRSDELSDRAETEAFEAFRDLLTGEDHRARMDKRIGAKDFSGASRAARRLGDDDRSIVKACAAVAANATKALDLLDAVATEPRHDLRYTLCRISWMARQNPPGD